MHICVVSPSYPTSKTIDFVFVDQLCRAFADLGHKVTVIAPQSLTKCYMRHIPVAPRHSFLRTSKENEIELYRPYYITLGNSGMKLFQNSFQNAVKRAFHKLKHKPDVCYGHFWQSIFAIYPLAKSNGIPLFGASGEENVSFYVDKPDEYKKALFSYLSGIVSVSTKNQHECLDLKLVSAEKSVVIPNAINNTLFKYQDRTECRKALGFPQSNFVVAFVGQFMPRKGALRLNEALKRINDEDVRAIFIGSGLEDPDYRGIIYKGRVPHDDVPKWLNASDVFVLPTENEGCSNAIIEAMACGLPIISTDAPFNYDVLNESNSIMIDCHDVNQIADAILTLKNDIQLRSNLATGALKTSQDLTLDKRAVKIIEFIHKQLKERV